MIHPEEIAFDVAKEQKPCIWSTQHMTFHLDHFFYYYIGTLQLRSSMGPENIMNFMSDDTYA